MKWSFLFCLLTATAEAAWWCPHSILKAVTSSPYFQRQRESRAQREREWEEHQARIKEIDAALTLLFYEKNPKKYDELLEEYLANPDANSRHGFLFDPLEAERRYMNWRIRYAPRVSWDSLDDGLGWEEWDQELKNYVTAAKQMGLWPRPAQLTPEQRLSLWRATQFLVFDGDDTLWQDQLYLQTIEKRVEKLLDDKMDKPSRFRARFAEIQSESLPHLGYGLHSYLTCLTQAFFSYEPYSNDSRADFHKLVRELTDGHSSSREAMPQANAVLNELTRRGYSLGLLTRGAAFEQQAKLELSGLKRYFHFIKVVPEKSEDTYREVNEEILRQRSQVTQITMIGNSVKSDIRPALATGWSAILIPAPVPWLAEDGLSENSSERFVTLTSLEELLARFE